MHGQETQKHVKGNFHLAQLHRKAIFLKYFTFQWMSSYLTPICTKYDTVSTKM